jgi:hypothetical protein
MADTPVLQLVRESKIAELFPNDRAHGAFEASGVLAKDGKFFVVCDNQTAVARLSQDLIPNDMNGCFGTAPIEGGYEGIAYNPDKGRYYLLIESLKRSRSRFRAKVVEYDDTLSYVRKRRIDFELKSANKGFEAVSHVRRDGRDYLLALCEGNRCRSGKQGRKPGKGRIQLFKKKKRRWSHVGRIKLPESVLFRDYSGMAIAGRERVAVVSQEESMLWIGEFDESAWRWRDEGTLYQFPRTSDGCIRYGNVEGVAWMTASRLVTVSDRRKPDQPECFSAKDQSIHIFDLPGPA